MKKIHIILSGGTGNQLFQIAMACYLIKNKPTQYGWENVLIYTNRLKSYNQPRSISPIIEQLSRKFGCVITKKESILTWLRPGKIINEIRRRVFNIEDEISISLLNHTVIDGYFQTKEHSGLYQLAAVVRELLISNGKSSDSASDNQLYSTISFILHFRGGDAKPYLNSEDLALYYSKALRKMLSQHKTEKKCLIFTDDLEWVTEIVIPILLELGIEYLCANEQLNKEIKLFKFTANGIPIICAPSTFSWWAAIAGGRKFISPGFFVASKQRKFHSKNEIVI